MCQCHCLSVLKICVTICNRETQRDKVDEQQYSDPLLSSAYTKKMHDLFSEFNVLKYPAGLGIERGWELQNTLMVYRCSNIFSGCVFASFRGRNTELIACFSMIPSKSSLVCTYQDDCFSLRNPVIYFQNCIALLFVSIKSMVLVALSMRNMRVKSKSKFESFPHFFHAFRFSLT